MVVICSSKSLTYLEFNLSKSVKLKDWDHSMPESLINLDMIIISLYEVILITFTIFIAKAVI